MMFTMFTINMSTDMQHHQMSLMFTDTPIQRGQKMISEQGVQVILDPLHTIQLFDGCILSIWLSCQHSYLFQSLEAAVS